MAVVVGTRPEIIKMAPVIGEVDALLGRGSALVIDTGQHFDESMSGQFWRELGLPAPEVKLDAGGMTRAGCLGYLTAELGRVFASFAPSVVLVQGDTNTTAAGALAANAEGIPLVHVEAGLRSYDRAMPEEHNRVITDHLADLCCAATPHNHTNLALEGIPNSRVLLTGNTIVEAVQSQLPSTDDQLAYLGSYGMRPDAYVLATIHRPENTDEPRTLRGIIEALVGLADRMPVLFPMHPRTRQAAKEAKCEDLLSRMSVVDPVGSRAFLSLAAHAAVLISDSGGVAEEVTVLKRPLVVVRCSTERAESMEAGFSHLVAPHQIASTVAGILSGHQELLARLAKTPCPYGNGTAAAQIARATSQLIELRKD
ncbi:UDP-N-acetylglucosamine 2-epimerase (non-hydrolyzing) [Streptomyces sp. NPDC048506]|uniref:non-hydrolyzing UDP-N-acetylglucosamine 2-epimerase n=1 Tax=Streptomyces sp. NPDC048506 TaxID=3155028 RepID=UPI00343DEED3